MKRERILILAALVLFGAMALIAVGIAAAASSGDGAEPPITGDAFTKASAAALEHTGGGRVTDSEVGDEDAFYEVEVTLADGSQVDVHLDQDFNVVGVEADKEGPEDGSGPDDD